MVSLWKGGKNKRATSVLQCHLVCTWDWCHWEAPSEFSDVEPFSVPVTSASLVPACCPLEPTGSLIHTTHVAAAAHALDVSSLT